MIPLVLGAAGAAVVAVKVLASRQSAQRQFPNVPEAWWTSRERLFRVKAAALAAVSGAQLRRLYESYAEAHPDDSFSRLLSSLVAGSRGDWKAARAHAERLAGEGPASVGHWRLVDCCVHLGDRASAIAAAREFIALEPESDLKPHLETLITRLEAELGDASPRPRPAKKPARPKKKRASPRRPAQRSRRSPPA